MTSAEHSAAPEHAPHRATRAPFLAIIIAATILSYWPVLHAGFMWDDDSYVTRNKTLRTLEGLGPIWLQPARTPQYYPLVHTSFWIEYRLWGVNPLGYHIINVAIQIANALLLWRVLVRLKVPGAWWVALLFAVHPVQVETVAWVTERKNLLACFFALLSILSWLRFCPWIVATDPSPWEDHERPIHWGWYGAALLLFVCALLSKTITSTLPPVLLVIAWWKRGKLSWRYLAATAPMFVLGAALGYLTVHLEQYHVGAQGEEWSLSSVGRLILAGRVAWFYVWKDLWPRTLIFVYPRWDIDPAKSWQIVYTLAAAAVLALLFVLRRRIGRGPAALAAIYLLTLFPAMGFFNVYPMRYSYVADHFQYLSIIPVLSGVVAAVMLVARNPKAQWGVGVAGSAIVIVLIFISRSHASAFMDDVALWTDTLDRNPRAWMAMQNLGNQLQTEKKYGDAMAMYHRVLALRPDDERAWSQIGEISALRGDHEKAIEIYREGLARLQGTGGSRRALLWINLAVELGTHGDITGAENASRHAIAAEPRNPAGYLNLGTSLAGQRRYVEATEVFEKGCAADPSYVANYAGLAMALANTGQKQEAIAACRAALREDENFQIARGLLVQLLRDLGRDREALAEELKIKQSARSGG